jgi:hypothetical protein
MNLGTSKNNYNDDSYEESRKQFLAAINYLRTNSFFKIEDTSFSDPENAELVTDVFLLKPSGSLEMKNLIVILSGVHGIEGYVGSAIQTELIKAYLNPANQNVHYLFIHALNPYGFKENRRVNRNNVDLNRNFLIDPSVFKSTKDNYKKLDSFLNPKEAVQVNCLSRWFFIIKVFFKFLKVPADVMKNTILQGQYEYPKGLYFGGSSYQYQKNNIDQIVNSTLLNYSQVFILDLHTGYGKKNKMHLFANANDKSSSKILNKIFLEKNIDYGDSKNFYETTGNLVGYLESKSNAKTKIFGVAFEFGTFDSQNIFGSIESLRRMIIENQSFHHSTNSRSKTKIELLFKKLFYPNDETFLPSALKQARHHFSNIVRHFE